MLLWARVDLVIVCRRGHVLSLLVWNPNANSYIWTATMLVISCLYSLTLNHSNVIDKKHKIHNDNLNTTMSKWQPRNGGWAGSATAGLLLSHVQDLNSATTNWSYNSASTTSWGGGLDAGSAGSASSRFAAQAGLLRVSMVKSFVQHSSC